MKRALTLLILITLISCSDGFNYKTTATYKAEASKLTVNLVATGYIIYGHDLDEDGIVTGYITSPKFLDSIYVQANEHKLLTFAYRNDTIHNNTAISLLEYLNTIGYNDYNTKELIELEKVIKASAYGPKGTYMKNQTNLIKVLSVDFNTK